MSRRFGTDRALRLVRRVDERLHPFVAADRDFLCVGKAVRIGGREVVRQQVSVEPPSAIASASGRGADVDAVETRERVGVADS